MKAKACLALGIAAMLGCGKKSASATIDITGGVVAVAGGPALQIPAGALTTAVTITIEEGGGAAPAGALSSVYKFGPEGTTFLLPANVSYPVATNTTGAALYWTKPGSSTDYDPLPVTIASNTASSQVTHLSLGVLVAGRTVAGAFTDIFQPDTSNPSSLPSFVSAGETVSALVPMTSQSTGYMTFPGSLTSTGTLTIPGVPSGHYLFTITPPSPPSQFVEMSTAAPDWSEVFSSRVDLVYGSNFTRLTLNVSGLDPWSSTDALAAISSQAGLSRSLFLLGGGPGAGSTTFNGNVSWVGYGLPNASKGDVVYFLQTVQGTAGSAPVAATTTTVTKCNPVNSLTITNGSTANATTFAMTVPAQTGSTAANVKLSQFESLAASVNPGAKRSGFNLSVHPLPHSVSFPDTPNGPYFKSFILDVSLSALTSAAPDNDYGTQTYGQCFDPLLWKEYRNVFYSWSVPIAGTSITGWPALYGASEPMSPAPNPLIVPGIGPVKSPMVNGKDAFTMQSGVTTQPTLSWSAPAVGTATSYSIAVYDTSFLNLALFNATVYSTSFRVPSGLMVAGKTYFAVITANQAPFDALDAAPRRTGTPHYSADAVTAAFTP